MKALSEPLLRLARTFSFIRGNILVLTISASLGMFSRNMVFPYVPLFILSLGGNPEQVGFVYALGPLGGLLMFPIAGYLADRMNRAILIAAAGYFSAAMLLINAVAPTWEWVAAARLLQGLAVFHFPASSAIIADSLPPEHRGRGMATTAALAGTLALFAPYIAGATLDRWGIDSGMRMLYVAMGAAYAAGATINLIFIRETRTSPVASFNFAYLTQTLRQAYSGIWPMLRGFTVNLRALSTVIILCFISNAVAGPFWVVYVTTHIGLRSSEWGLILLVETGLRNLVTVPAGFLTDHYGRCRFILAALAVSLVVPLFVWSGSFLQVLLIRCLIGIASAFLSPAMGALMADSVPSQNRGRVMAAVGRGSVMIGGASGGIGGPGTGYLITGPLVVASLAGGALYAWNPLSPFLVVFGITLLALLVAFRYMRDPLSAEI